MSKTIDSWGGKRIAIIGGGQLAKMTALSALEFGCHVSVLERKKDVVTIDMVHRALIGDWDDPADLIRLAEHSDIVTLENEFVDAGSLAKLSEAGYTILPTAESIALVQDKLLQKTTLQKNKLPLPHFRAVESRQQIIEFAEEFSWPVVLKKRRNGYDGKGNFTIAAPSEIDTALAHLGDAEQVALYVESFCDFDAELAIIITTDISGQAVTYPLVSSVQREHICHIIRAPAPVSDAIAANAVDIAQNAVAAVGAIGSFAVEMFLKDGEIMLNELAPRVHNSGHYTMEACECSQFENHIRAIMNWPLGSSRMLTPAAVMVNLLAQGHGSGQARGFEKALAIPGAHIHIYGKKTSTPGRKMGHVTVLGETLLEAEEKAQQAADLIHFGDH